MSTAGGSARRRSKELHRAGSAVPFRRRRALGVFLAFAASGSAWHARAQGASPLTATFANGVSISFSRALDGGASGGLVAATASDAVVRAFTDVSACTYFGYELRARPLPSGRIEVALGPLTGKGEASVREYLRESSEFSRAGCSAPRALAAPAPRFPPPRSYADGESLSISLLTNPRTGATLKDQIRVVRAPAGRTPEPFVRAQLAAEIEALRSELREREERFLSTSEEDRAAFADWLRQADTGLVRLLPREKYAGKLTLRGGGSYYSFTRLSHDYNENPQIGLEQGSLKTGFAGADYGFLVRLGDVPLEHVTTEHPGVRFLASRVVPTTEPQARQEQRQASAGIEVEGLGYRRSLPAVVGETYALRSISYRAFDVLVALRIVREDRDGSLILLWRRLKQYPVPHLVDGQ